MAKKPLVDILLNRLRPDAYQDNSSRGLIGLVGERLLAATACLVRASVDLVQIEKQEFKLKTICKNHEIVKTKVCLVWFAFWKIIKAKEETSRFMVYDILVPNNNEVELAEFAKNLGFDEIILLYVALSAKKSAAFPGIAAKRACFVKNINDVSVAKSRFDLVFAPAERQFFESKKVDFVVGAESSELKDLFYQRRAGLDDAMCKLAKENGITVVFNASVSDDKVMLGRLEQNARLCRKHKVNFVVATFANKPLSLRSPNDVLGFARYLGIY